jgi:3-oxoacyl-[acyl-carrier-protein] synthase II
MQNQHRSSELRQGNYYDQAPPRVVITGMGAITPLGLGVDEVWEGLLAGRSGIDYISRFDTSELYTKIAGEVRNFDPTNHMSGKEARRLDPYIQYALAATQEAVVDAKIDFGQELPNQVGVIITSAVGGLKTILDNQATAQTYGLRGVSPFMVSNVLIDSAGSRIATEYNLRGPNHSVVSACASGTAACGEAFELLRRGDAEVMIVGGSEAGVLPLIIAGFNVMGALSKHNEDPAAASRPFDANREGFVLSEGCAILIMETEAHARKRNARIYAEVIGYGSSADAFNMVAPHEKGCGAVNAMRMALCKAADYGVQSHDVDYINAHGTGTRANDVIETYAIKQVFGDHAYHVPISSTKSMLGHLAGAAGAIETVICAKVITEGVIPPTINLHNPDPDCDLNYTPLRVQRADIKVALNNSFGFGGHNACILLKSYSDEQKHTSERVADIDER